MDGDLIDLMEELIGIYGVNVRRFNHSFKGIERIDNGMRLHLYTDYHYDDTKNFFTNVCKKDTLYIGRDQFGIWNMSFKINALEVDEEYITIGPYLLQEDKDKLAAEEFDNTLSLEFRLRLNEYYNSIAVIGQREIFEELVYILLQRILKNAKQVDVLREESKSSIYDGSGIVKDEGKEELSTAVIEERYHLEEMFMELMEKGDVDQAVFQKLYTLDKYRLEPRGADKFREGKNNLIILNCLCRKAVQKADVHPIHIDKLSSYFARKIELITSIQALNKLSNEMVRKYCLLVQNQSLRGYSVTVQKAINYIEFHLSEQLSLSIISKNISNDASYLSARFKKEVGNTITEYINSKRIEKSLIYLVTTNLSIQTITEKVGFNEENYFSKTFKKMKKITPTEYRNKLQKF